jgi:hypothetical protein
MSMKNSNDTIRNRTRDLPACSAEPQPTPPPRAHFESTLFFFSMARQLYMGLVLLVSSRFHGHTLFRHTTLGRTPLDEGPARRRDLYLTTHNTHKRQTSMPPLGFEPTILISDSLRPQGHWYRHKSPYPWQKNVRNPSNRSLGESQSRFGSFEAEKNILPLSEIETQFRVIQPVSCQSLHWLGLWCGNFIYLFSVLQKIHDYKSILIQYS